MLRAAACSALEAYTRILCNANLYLTPAGAQGFDAHYDWMDGLVVQLDGAKRWRLYPPLVALPPRARRGPSATWRMARRRGRPRPPRAHRRAARCA